MQKKKLTVNVNGKNYDVVGEIGLSHTAIDITGSDVKIGDVASVEISPLMVNQTYREYLNNNKKQAYSGN